MFYDVSVCSVLNEDGGGQLWVSIWPFLLFNRYKSCWIDFISQIRGDTWYLKLGSNTRASAPIQAEGHTLWEQSILIDTELGGIARKTVHAVSPSADLNTHLTEGNWSSTFCFQDVVNSKGLKMKLHQLNISLQRILTNNKSSEIKSAGYCSPLWNEPLCWATELN